jgi:hypothetical protein
VYCTNPGETGPALCSTEAARCFGSLVERKERRVGRPDLIRPDLPLDEHLFRRRDGRHKERPIGRGVRLSPRQRRPRRHGGTDEGRGGASRRVRDRRFGAADGGCRRGRGFRRLRANEPDG